jgi:hypothetical protein
MPCLKVHHPSISPYDNSTTTHFHNYRYVVRNRSLLGLPKTTKTEKTGWLGIKFKFQNLGE